MPLKLLKKERKLIRKRSSIFLYRFYITLT